MATNEQSGVEAQDGMPLPLLTEEDKRVIGHIFGAETFSPETLSPAAKVAVLQRLVKMALPREDRAFKTIANLVKLPPSLNGSGARIYALQSEGSLRFALLATYTDMPSPVYYAKKGTARETKSSHLLIERPPEGLSLYTFWSLEITWELAQVNLADEGTFEGGYAVGMNWTAKSRVMKPLYGKDFGDALTTPAIGPAGDPSDALRESMRGLMHYADRTLRHRESRLEEASLRSGFISSAAAHMGVKF